MSRLVLEITRPEPFGALLIQPQALPRQLVEQGGFKRRIRTTWTTLKIRSPAAKDQLAKAPFDEQSGRRTLTPAVLTDGQLEPRRLDAMFERHSGTCIACKSDDEVLEGLVVWTHQSCSSARSASETLRIIELHAENDLRFKISYVVEWPSLMH